MGGCVWRQAVSDADHPCKSASVPFSWFESHYIFTAASLAFEHGQLTNWNIYYRKTEGQNMFATPTASVQQARLLVNMLQFFSSLISLIEQTCRPRLPSCFGAQKDCEDTFFAFFCIVRKLVNCVCVRVGERGFFFPLKNH